MVRVRRYMNIRLIITLCLIILASMLVMSCGNNRVNNKEEQVSSDGGATFELQNESQLTQEGDDEEQNISSGNEKVTSNDEIMQDGEGTLSEATSVSIVMGGDVMLHERVRDSGIMEDGTRDYNHLFDNIRSDIEEADIAIVNQEIILGGEQLGLTGYPNFNGAFEVGDALYNAGFDVVLHATNHALDRGKAGIVNCINYWKNTHPDVKVIGIHDSEMSYDDIPIIEKNGIKIAILNYSYGSNGIPTPAGMDYAVSFLDDDKMSFDIAKAKSMADFVIVAPHWGKEYNLDTTKEQAYYTKFFLDNGVDLVIGTHPHVLEPIEWMESEDGHRMLVYYSIGNLINASNMSGRGVADRTLGALAKVTITKETDGSSVITEYGAIPVVSHVDSANKNVTVIKLEDYTQELIEVNDFRKQDTAFDLNYLNTLSEKMIGELDRR